MKRWRAVFVASFSSLVVAACAAGESQSSRAALVANEAWARGADSGATAAVYFTLINPSDSSDTLTGVTSDVAEKVEMHMSMQHGNTMHMSPMSSLPVPANDSVTFRPLGAHVMLVGLKRPLSDGDSVSVSLTFGSGRRVPLTARVRRP